LATERNANTRLRGESPRAFARDNIIGQSRGIQSILEMVPTVAYTSGRALSAGDSGTSKEVAARAIRKTCRRKDG